MKSPNPRLCSAALAAILLSGAALAQAPTPAPNAAPIPPPAQSSGQTSANAPAVDTAAVTEKAAQALTAVRTAEGAFTQIDERGVKASGKFYISRPGKVRFEYTSPEPMFIVSDGVTVSQEEPKRDSYTSLPLASTPLHLFLRSNVDLRRDGSVTKVTANNGSYFVTLVDKSGESQGRMTLEFRAADFELLGWTLTDGTDAQTRVALTGTQKNVALNPALFIVKDPADKRDDRR